MAATLVYEVDRSTSRSRRTAVGWVLDLDARSLMLEYSGFSILVNYVTCKKGAKNRALLAFTGGEFDVFITSDQNIRYQQNLTGSNIAVLELQKP